MTQPVVIRAVGFANGQPCPIAGQYLRAFDHDGCGGRGWGDFTLHLPEAMQFEDSSEAFGFWRKQSTVKPFREDGEPNRPLTCTHVEILPYDKAETTPPLYLPDFNPAVLEGK